MPTPQDREAARRAQRTVRVALALLICVVVALVAAGALAAYRIYTLGNHRFIDQAGPFFAVTEDLSVEMLNEETGVRGYVITGDPKTLQPYHLGQKNVRLELKLLDQYSSLDSSIPAHVAAVRKEIDELETYFSEEVALVRNGPTGQRAAEKNIQAGKVRFDRFRATSALLIGDAAAVIKRSHHEQRSTLITWFSFLGVAGVVAVAIAVGLLLRVPGRLYNLFREERRARREAERSGDAARALTHVRDPVVLLDEQGLLRYWNPAAETLFELSEPGTVTALEETVRQFHDTLEQAGPRPVVINDREVWLAYSESEFEGGRVVVFRDVSDDQRLERLRSDFVATAAHELRTPLAAVYGAVRTLRQAEHAVPPEMTERLLQMIEDESERLKLVMDQLLVSAQIDSADLHIHRERVDAVALCEGVVGTVEVRKPAGIELDVQTPSADVWLEADGDRLRQVVANLVDNAIKYSPGGGSISLRVSANGSFGLIDVVDHGLGIPAQEQQRIFEKFYRLDPSMTRGVGGSGLGLYISRELVEQMGGRLSVVSRYEYGSTFTVALPLAPPA